MSGVTAPPTSGQVPASRVLLENETSQTSDTGRHSSGTQQRLIVAEGQPTILELLSWCLTGMSGWWSLNVITAELPYFIAELPEAERLGNLIAVCTQVGNIFPIIYKIVYTQGQGNLTTVIGLAQLISTATLITTGLMWSVTVGNNSIVLLACTVLSGGVGCLSNVTYWAVAAWHPPGCTRAMSVGMTFGGLLANGLSSLQLAGRRSDDPRFDPKVYFFCAAVLQALQLAAFICQVRRARQEEAHTPPGSRSHSAPTLVNYSTATAAEAALAEEEAQCVSLEDGDQAVQVVVAPDEGIQQRPEAKVPLPFLAKVFLVGCFLIYGATYTVPTLQPYIVAGYPTSTQRQQLLLVMLTLQNTGDVLGRMSTVCVTGRRAVLIVWGAILVSTFASMVYFAVVRHWSATVLSFQSALLLFGAISGAYYFSRGLLVTALMLRARSLGDKSFAERLSMNMGFVGQMGALSANVVTFLCANVFNVI